ncbi:MAG: S9 family peptidase, partial [Paramuribaculum sp.]|nr:S9 family peptidase [Paramuribaculum sp.]
MKKTIIVSVAAAAAAGALVACHSPRKIQYPEAPVDTTAVDNYFGTEVADPYRPLENDTSAATTAWVEAENKVTGDYLAQIPFREGVRRRLTALNNYTKSGMPWRNSDGKYYYS